MRASRHVLLFADDTPFYELINRAAPAGWLMCWLASLFGERRVITDAGGLRIAGYWWRGDLWITELHDRRSLAQWLKDDRQAQLERAARCALWAIGLAMWAVILVSDARASNPGDWSARWAWHQDRLDVDWTPGDQALGRIQLWVTARTFTGRELSWKLDRDASEGPVTLTGGRDNWFYCAVSVDVVFRYGDHAPKSQRLERPYNYPPAVAGRCT